MNLLYHTPTPGANNHAKYLWTNTFGRAFNSLRPSEGHAHRLEGTVQEGRSMLHHLLQLVIRGLILAFAGGNNCRF